MKKFSGTILNFETIYLVYVGLLIFNLLENPKSVLESGSVY